MHPSRMTAVFAVVFAVSALAGPQATVAVREGLGEAAILKGDEQRAFDEAKARALRQAVETAAGVRIDADSVAVNNQLVRDQVFANTSGYVKKYEVVEKKVEKGVISVKVKAEVITDNLDKDIQAARDLVARAGRPKLVILVQEQTLSTDGKATVNSSTVATVLTEAFKADGYDIKDPAFAAGKLKVGAAIGAAEAKEIGDLSKAQFILYGTASFHDQIYDPNSDKQTVFSVTGEYDLTLFSTDDGTVVTKISEPLKFVGGEGVSKSLLSYERTALNLVKTRQEEIAASVRKGVLEHLRSQYVNGRSIALTVGGLESFGAAKDFLKSVSALKGIKDGVQDGFANGKASYRVNFLGSTSELAEHLEAATFKRRKLNVVSVTGNTMEVVVAK